jgi:hypothetical protein
LRGRDGGLGKSRGIDFEGNIGVKYFSICSFDSLCLYTAMRSLDAFLILYGCFEFGDSKYNNSQGQSENNDRQSYPSYDAACFHRFRGLLFFILRVFKIVSSILMLWACWFISIGPVIIFLLILLLIFGISFPKLWKILGLSYLRPNSIRLLNIFQGMLPLIFLVSFLRHFDKS